MAPEDFRVIIAAIVAVTVCATFLLSNWMRMRHGYPVETTLGLPMQPHRNAEIDERVRLLTQENAQQRAEIGAIKDRIVSIEKIVTDRAWRLDREIDALRGAAN